MYCYEELTLTLSDGYRAYARHWPVERPRGAVLFLHGIQSHCGWYERSAAWLQQAGFAVLQPDRRGSGRNTQQRGHAENQRQLIDDAAQCGRALMERTGTTAYHLLGISWGGKLAAALLTAEQAPIRSVTLVCPGLFPRVDVKPAQKLRIGLSMLGSREQLYDIPLNDPMLFTSQPQWIEFLRSDPLSLHQVSAAFFLATRRMDAAVRRLEGIQAVPLHLLLAGQDAIIDSDRTACFVRQLNWPDGRITRYPEARHTLEFEPIWQDYCADLVEFLSRHQG